MPKNSGRWLILILALGLLLRVGYDLAERDRPLQGDERSYDRIAWNVATGNGYSGSEPGSPPVPTAVRGPGYVLLLAATYRIGGHQRLLITLVQAVLEAVSLVLVWRIGRRLFASPWLALGGALIYAVYPPFIENAAGVLTETYVNLTVVLAIERGLAWSIGGSRSALLVSGLAMGACALAKPQLGPIAVLIAIAGRPDPRTREFWVTSLIQVLMVTAVLSPWIVRNAFVFHRFLPGVTQGGITFWGGTGPDEGRVVGGVGEPGVPPHVLAAVAGKDEREIERYFYAEGVRVIRAHPARYVALMFKKLVRLWFNLWHDAPPSRNSLMLAAFHLGAMILAGVALATLHPPAPAVRLLGWMVIHFSLVHMVFYSNVRYAMPCFAYLFIFTGAALAHLFFRRQAGVAT